MAPQLLGSSNFDPQLQNRPMLIPQLSKSFTFSTWTRLELFCPTWSGFDHATLALTMPRWPSLSSRSCVREGDNGGELATAMARQQAAAAAHEQATATVASLRQTKLTMAGAERRAIEEGDRGGDGERLGHGGLELQ